MSFRESISSLVGATWSIDLATHLNTKLENETSSPSLSATPLRQKGEQRFASMAKLKDPVSGYNCFGLVFASRRTSLYDPDVSLILTEDGYGEVATDAEIRAGDVVIYSDDRGPTHAALVTRLAPALHLAGSGETAWVLSKFDDTSGEYEHTIDNLNWIPWPEAVFRKVYRPRTRSPQRKVSWRQRVEES